MLLDHSKETCLMCSVSRGEIDTCYDIHKITGRGCWHIINKLHKIIHKFSGCLSPAKFSPSLLRPSAPQPCWPATSAQASTQPFQAGRPSHQRRRRQIHGKKRKVRICLIFSLIYLKNKRFEVLWTYEYCWIPMASRPVGKVSEWGS